MGLEGAKQGCDLDRYMNEWEMCIGPKQFAYAMRKK